MERKTIIVVCGPTAAGKTRLGIELCQLLGGEVVSADSMQVYRGMDIGTAKPTQAEMEGIAHHMLSVCEPEEAYSVARYVREATACVEDIFARGKQPIIVGGTGLYIEALCRGEDFADRLETPTRLRLQEEAKQIGAPQLWQRLQVQDPESAARMHENDEKRIIRALEVLQDTGKPLSEHNAASKTRPSRYRRVVIGLDYADRADLRARIGLRVDEMIAQGLIEEVKALLARNLSKEPTALQAIGYKELQRALRGEAPMQQAVDEVKLRSGQYAKRQLSWFRRLPDIHWIIWEKNPNFSLALQNSILYLREEGIQ